MYLKPVILCGGSGTRLWPLSTPERPKQFQALTGSDSMIVQTAKRLQSADAPFEVTRPLIVGSQRHETLLRTEIPNADLILEPFGRNSAPAIAAACLSSKPDDLLLILPADHHIARPESFLEAIGKGLHAAMNGRIITFGITPTHAATGYGYIQAEPSEEPVWTVAAFVEKPDADTASAYLETGSFYWNAGIFLFRAQSMLEALESHEPNLVNQVAAALDPAKGGVRHLQKEAFATAKNISIDYAVMERADNIGLIPVDMGWSDLGGYEALWALGASEPAQNVVLGPVILENSQGVFARSDGPILSASGLKNVVLIAGNDQVMVAPIGDAEAIKRLGATSQTNTLTHSIKRETRQQAKDLLWDAFDLWSEIGWDPQRGGFVESADLSGQPNSDLPRRVRVQARQVFSFSEAARLGWSDPPRAQHLVDLGLTYLDTACRHPDGGWSHIVTADGHPHDPTRGLYDHAFIILAGAAAWRAFENPLARRLAEDAFLFIEENMRDADIGGYADSMSSEVIRRANPHMHLLEAFLEWHDATEDPVWLERAGHIVTIFESDLFVPEQDMLREHFVGDWRAAPGQSGRIYEPGHHYEWATLLAAYDRRTHRDTRSWRHRLIRRADRDGRNSNHGFALNEVDMEGRIQNPNSRIWPQLEAFRTRLWHPGTAAPGETDRWFQVLKSTYFDPMPAGTWIDEIDEMGQSIATAVPASILYHLVTAFRDILPNEAPSQ